MGGMEDFNKKQFKHQQISTSLKLKIVLLVLLTNILTTILLRGSTLRSPFSFPSIDGNSLMKELNSTRAQLFETRAHISNLNHHLIASNAHIVTLLEKQGHGRDDVSGSETWPREPSGELKYVIEPHNIPFGTALRYGSDRIYLPFGAACSHFHEDVANYMNYKVGGECPSDDVFAQKLMLKGCEPLPRRRCHPKSPKGFVEPNSLPGSLWTTPPDTSIVWDPYTCKNYDCLVNRMKRDQRFYDCKDCFDLNGRESKRWTFDSNDLDYGIDAILAYKAPGTIRIGLDLGGGSGTFAARMMERNVTMITTSMNFDGPFNSFIASRGLIPMHLSIAHRFPFFDNTLDIVHSMHLLSNWIPDLVLEFALYDIYRVLRPGGLFWLDHFFCIGGQLNGTYVPMFERVGFNKIRLNAGRKFDKGVEMNEWYLSALFEKPMY